MNDYLGIAGALPYCAEVISECLRRNGFEPAQAVNRQVLGLAEEVGEFVGAYRRWTGQARRSGTAEDMYEELADVIITAFVTAHELNIDINAVIAAKLHKVHTRGWRDSAPCSHPTGVHCSRCIDSDPDYQAHHHRVPMAVECSYCPDPDEWGGLTATTGTEVAS